MNLGKAPKMSATWREIIVGPRWARFSSFLKDECFARGLKLTVLEQDKGWIRETVRFEVEGDGEKIEALKREVYTAVDDYNRRRNT